MHICKSYNDKISGTFLRGHGVGYDCKRILALRLSYN